MSITLKAIIVKSLLCLSKEYSCYKLLYKNLCLKTVCQLFSDQEQSLPFPIMIYLYASLLSLPYLLQVKLYNGELLSTLSCLLVSVMLLVRIIFIDTSLHKPVDMFTELSFLLGTIEV